jgi:hypothetical protein
MRQISIIIILGLILLSCKKREYVHENSFCVYKNYFNPEIIPFEISNMKQLVHDSVKQSNGVLCLNAFDFVDNHNLRLMKINDSAYNFLYKKYLEACGDYEMNQFGIDSLNSGIIKKVAKAGCFYFCGRLELSPTILSLVFLESNSDRFYNYNDLLLFNIKNNKLYSIIKLSSFEMDEKAEDVLLKTYLIKDKFVSVENPSEDYGSIQSIGLKNTNNKLDFDISTQKTLYPFLYYIFSIDKNGYIHLTPTSFKLNNIQILNKEGKIHNPKFVM